MLGNGHGTFAPAVSYAAGNGPASLVTGDFNRDGNLDLAVANGLGGSISLVLGNGDGTFQVAVGYAVSFMPVSIAAVDLNQDGARDLVVGNSEAQDLSVLLNTGWGSPLVSLYRPL